VLYKAAQLLAEAPPMPESEQTPIYRVEEDPREFSVEKTDDGWLVVGKSIERAAAMTYWEYDQSVRRFQRIMQALGIEDALRKAGVQEGESVIIGDFELEWQD
jgi:GTPase